MYPGITLFHLTIPSYWVMALIGAILSFLFVHIRKRKFHIPGDDVTHIFLFCVVGGIITAASIGCTAEYAGTFGCDEYTA